MFVCMTARTGRHNTLVIRSIPAKICLYPRARGHSVHALRRGSLTRLQKVLVSGLDPWNRCAEEARTKDPSYQSMPIVEGD